MENSSTQSPKIDVDAVLTEPMRVNLLAHYFDVEPHTMRRLLNVIPGATKIGGLWRVPVVSMPPRYLVVRGLIRPATIPVDGTNWNRFAKSPFSSAGKV